MPEADAIRLAQQGDAAAFERLYRLHNRRVYSLCLRMVGNTAEAEDLTQEAFLQLFRKIATFRGESAFSTWLHRLAVNVVLMKLRKKSGTESSLEEMTEPDEESGGPRRDFGGPDLRLSGSIDRVNLQRAVEQLPPGLQVGIRPARCAGLRAQRNCGNHGLLDRQFEISIAQGAHAASRVASRSAACQGPRRSQGCQCGRWRRGLNKMAIDQVQRNFWIVWSPGWKASAALTAQAHIRSCPGCHAIVNDLNAIQAEARAWSASEHRSARACLDFTTLAT